MPSGTPIGCVCRKMRHCVKSYGPVVSLSTGIPMEKLARLTLLFADMFNYACHSENLVSATPETTQQQPLPVPGRGRGRGLRYRVSLYPQRIPQPGVMTQMKSHASLVRESFLSRAEDYGIFIASCSATLPRPFDSPSTSSGWQLRERCRVPAPIDECDRWRCFVGMAGLWMTVQAHGGGDVGRQECPPHHRTGFLRV